MEYLPDPVNDRPLKDLPPFANNALDEAILFPNGETPNWKLLEEFLSKEGPITKK